jgi:hypothetical protein
MPSPFVERAAVRLPQPHPKPHAGILLDDFELLDLVRRRDHLLGQAETEREILGARRIASARLSIMTP